MPKSKMPKQPALAPQFLRVGGKGPNGKVQRINLSYVTKIDSDTIDGGARRIVFLEMHDGKEIAVGHADEIAALARILNTTPEDLLK
jgi:hypothetical protein